MHHRRLSPWWRFLSAVASACAQNIAGTWQGTLQTPQRALRLVMKVTRADDESLKAVFYSIDQSGQGFAGNAVSLQGTTFKAAIPAIGGSYEGKLSADGSSINGTFTQGSPIPLVLTKATAPTEWVIPEAPKPLRPMAADAKPTFEVASIKPSVPGAPGQGINVGRGGANTFTTLNTPLSELVKFAYGVHAKQVTGGPSWFDSEKFDIVAKPDTAGMPNVAQLQSMVKLLLGERFGLEFHREKKELPAYVITVDKGGWSEANESRDKPRQPARLRRPRPGIYRGAELDDPGVRGVHAGAPDGPAGGGSDGTYGPL